MRRSLIVMVALAAVVVAGFVGMNIRSADQTPAELTRTAAQHLETRTFAIDNMT